MDNQQITLGHVYSVALAILAAVQPGFIPPPGIAPAGWQPAQPILPPGQAPFNLPPNQAAPLNAAGFAQLPMAPVNHQLDQLDLGQSLNRALREVLRQQEADAQEALHPTATTATAPADNATDLPPLDPEMIRAIPGLQNMPTVLRTQAFLASLGLSRQEQIEHLSHPQVVLHFHSGADLVHPATSGAAESEEQGAESEAQGAASEAGDAEIYVTEEAPQTEELEEGRDAEDLIHLLEHVEATNQDYESRIAVLTERVSEVSRNARAAEVAGNHAWTVAYEELTDLLCAQQAETAMWRSRAEMAEEALQEEAGERVLQLLAENARLTGELEVERADAVRRQVDQMLSSSELNSPAVQDNGEEDHADLCEAELDPELQLAVEMIDAMHESMQDQPGSSGILEWNSGRPFSLEDMYGPTAQERRSKKAKRRHASPQQAEPALDQAEPEPTSSQEQPEEQEGQEEEGPDGEDIQKRAKHPVIKELMNKLKGSNEDQKMCLWDPKIARFDDDGRPKKQTVNFPPRLHQLKRFAAQRGEVMTDDEGRRLHAAIGEEQAVQKKMGALIVGSRKDMAKKGQKRQKRQKKGKKKEDEAEEMEELEQAKAHSSDDYSDEYDSSTESFNPKRRRFDEDDGAGSAGVC